MTIGLTDLLRRTTPLLCIALPLAACSHDDGERLAAFVQGNPPPVDTQYAALAMTVVDVSSVEPAAVVEQVAVNSEEASGPIAYVPPPPPPCEPVTWRGGDLRLHDDAHSWVCGIAIRTSFYPRAEQLQMLVFSMKGHDQCLRFSTSTEPLL